MQLITTRNKEISFAELKKAISSGNGLELIRPGDKFAIELKNGELVNAVCGGYVNEKRARFVLEDSLAEKWRMNDTPTNKGGYLKSEGRRHVLEDILPLFPDELAAEFLAVLIVTAVVFTKGLSAALAWRGYKAVGGEFMLLLLPIIYYEAKRIILDFVADFVELYRRAED